MPSNSPVKLPMDDEAIKNWPMLKGGDLSRNGEFLVYVSGNSRGTTDTLSLKHIQSKQRLTFAGTPASYQFSPDSKKFLILNAKDSLAIVSLDSWKVKYIPNVSSFQIASQGKACWMAYSLKAPMEKLVLLNLSTDEELSLANVMTFRFAENGIIVHESLGKDQTSSLDTLYHLNLCTKKRNILWTAPDTSSRLASYLMDPSGNQLAYMLEQSGLNDMVAQKAIWYYNLKTRKQIKLAEDDGGLLRGQSISDIHSFTEDGTGLLFKFKENEPSLKKDASIPSLNIWSYMDEKLQSQQLKEGNTEPTYLALSKLENNKFILLEGKNENCFKVGKDYAYIFTSKGNADPSETPWNAACETSFHLLSLRDGQKREISIFKDFVLTKENISPSEKYIVFYNSKENNYISYDLETGRTVNLTNKINTCWLHYYRSDRYSAPRGIAAWLPEDRGFLVYDQNDIWQLDLTGQHDPINVTNGYGKRNHIIFNLPKRIYASKIINPEKKLYILGFHLLNKKNGFFSTTLEKNANPETLSFGNYVYDIPDNPYLPDCFTVAPMKAEDANIYLVTRMSVDQSPNLFITKNFKDFNQETFISPESKYRWLTNELHEWKAMDGETVQGVLYKPENFDPHKKYPVIFHYYERKSDGLNAYLKPETLNRGSINIPYYIMNGYLLFTPDIHYQKGNPMQCAVNSLVSAARYLSQFSFVDKEKFGLQGFSFGGIQTNYLITQTNLFAAACSGAGLSDWVSGYNGLFEDGQSLQSFYEIGQARMSGTLWEKPEQYIKNSPIFGADKVTTPLLMMHTTHDGICPFSNAFEFYSVLRRLGKRVWLIEYNNGNHGISGKEADDFSKRMLQFFNYYLKSALPPSWMSRGIPARYKGIETGLELDSNTRILDRKLIKSDENGTGGTQSN